MTSRNAHSEYRKFLEDHKRMETLAKQNQLEQERLTEERKNVERKKDEICKQLSVENRLLKDLANEQETAKEIINEASIKLSSAVKNNNMTFAQVAQMMLRSGNSKLQEMSKKMEIVQGKIEK